jgi:hypothetical protein
MPGFNGTGPRGMGPMTGGARGYCVLPGGEGMPRFGAGGRSRRALGGLGLGLGRGRGAWGMGRGLGRGYGPPAFDMPYGSVVSERNELEILRQEAESVEGDLGRIRARIGELEQLERD